MDFNNPTYQRIKIFEDTIQQCRENETLFDAVAKSIEDTKLYMPDEYPEINKTGSDKNGKITVTKERTLEASKKLHDIYPESRIGVLNFASATNPGGGVTKGSSAQEESLCRCSTLYPCLHTSRLFSDFYKMHHHKKDLCYTDTCIYTPDIVVMKSDTPFPENIPQKEWFSVDILTCAAPNLRHKPYNSMNPGVAEPINISDWELLAIHKKRGSHILNIAVANNIDVLVLGAFGCGAFCNNPSIVARAYKEIIPDYKKYFREIRFAVYCSHNHSGNYDTFNKILGNL